MPCRGAVVVISSDLLVSLLQLSITCIRQGGQNVATPVVNIAGAGKVQTPRVPLSNLRACTYFFFFFSLPSQAHAVLVERRDRAEPQTTPCWSIGRNETGQERRFLFW